MLLLFKFYIWTLELGLEKLSKLLEVAGVLRIDPMSSEITFHALSTTTCM